MAKKPALASAENGAGTLPEALPEPVGNGPLAAAGQLADPRQWPAAAIEWRKVAELVPYAANARLHTAEQVAQIAASMREWGWTMPVLIDPGGEIIAGHGRIMAAQQLGLIEAPCAVARGWSDLQKRAYRLADNKLTLNAAWDGALLKLEMGDLRDSGFDLGLTGFSTDELQLLWHGPPPSTGGNLAERFGVPPFSVLNAREGWWQDRKAAWLRTGIESDLGRGEAGLGRDNGAPGGGGGGAWAQRSGQRAANAIPGGSRQPAINPATGKIVRADSTGRPIIPGEMRGGMTYGAVDMDDGAERSGTSGTSMFDPVLAELLVRWFAPPGGLILDPFAGGSVRGIVAAKLGRRYLGIDLSARQIAANCAQRERILHATVSDLRPEWIVGDARDLPRLAAGIEADFLLSCPPYADLERYSDDPADLSTLAYGEFRRELASIIKRAVDRLKADRFACFVVGDVRGGKNGNYHGLPAHVIEAFEAAGASLYNEAILVTATGSLAIRVAKQFTTSRKLGKTHQNVLVFCKGDARKATEAIGEVEFGAIEPAPEALGGVVQ